MNDNLVDRLTPSESHAAAQSRWSGRTTVIQLFVIGALLAAIGGAMAISAWPGTEVLGSGYAYESGSAGAAWTGVVFAGIGQTLLFIAVIACAVRIGTRPDIAGPGK